MRLGWLVAGCALALGLSGCAQHFQTVGGRARPASENIQRVVSLSPSTTEVLEARNALHTLVGRGAADNFPLYVQPIPVVAGVKPDYEMLAQMKPDLIVYDADLYSDADVARLKQLGAKLFAFDGHTVDEYIKEVYELGQLVGSETHMANYVETVQLARKEAQGDPPPPQNVAVIDPGPNGSDLIAGTGSFQADLVRCAGGTPVGPGADRFVPMNDEELVKLNPDTIVTAGDPTPVFNDPKLASLSAVKNKRVMGMNADVLLRRGCRVDIAITNLHTILVTHK